MSLRRLAGLIGFCFMLISITLLTHFFVLMWLYGVDQLTVHANAFGERSLELALLFGGFCLVPITIYELDELLRKAD